MSTVSIKPYLRADILNHGLEKAGLVIADNCEQGQWLRCLDNGNGVKTYITGLNEDVPAIQDIEDNEKREAKILDIRKTVVMLERNIAGNYNISEADIYSVSGKKKVRIPGSRNWEEVDGQAFNPLFWTKVTKFKSVIPDEYETDGKTRKQTFWDTVQLVCNNTPKILDTNNAYDVMLIHAIEAGGFGNLLAPSLEAANEFPGNTPYKWYLDRLEHTAAIEVELDKLRNEAGSILQDLSKNKPEQLFYIVKNLSQYSLGYIKRTPTDIIYADINKHLNGLGAQSNKRLAIEEFLELCDAKKYPAGTLRVRAIAKDAVAMNIVAPKGDNVIYHIKKGNPMGKNFEDVVMYLNNPANSDVLLDVTEHVQKFWDGK